MGFWLSTAETARVDHGLQLGVSSLGVLTPGTMAISWTQLESTWNTSCLLQDPTGWHSSRSMYTRCHTHTHTHQLFQNSSLTLPPHFGEPRGFASCQTILRADHDSSHIRTDGGVTWLTPHHTLSPRDRCTQDLKQDIFLFRAFFPPEAS